MRSAFITILILFSTTTIAPAQDSAYVDLAKEILQLFIKEDFDDFNNYVDSSVIDKLNEEFVKEFWSKRSGYMGDFKEVLKIKTQEKEPYHLVHMKCVFEKGDFFVRQAFTEEGKLAGIFFLPARSTAAYKDPEYVELSKMWGTKTTIISGDYELNAEYTAPRDEGKYSVIILVHGSGPHDKDETIGPNKPFRDLALGLPAKDIAVMRYEKRTYAHPEKVMSMSDSLTVEQEVIEDALAAIEKVKEFERTDPDRIYIAGHSLGAMLAPRIATQTNDLAGIILLAGNARPLEDVLKEQYLYLLSPDGIDQQERKVLDTLELQINNLKKLENSDPLGDYKKLPLELPSAYWKDLLSYDQVAAAAQLNIPVLILQGERDYQVTMKDFEEWKSQLGQKKSVEFKSYPKLNHLFMEGEGKSMPSEYQKSGNIPEYVIDDIAEWVR